MKRRLRERTSSIALLLSVLVLTVVIASSRTCAQTFTSIDVPNAILTQAFGINDTGEIVGVFTDSSNRTHGFVRAVNGSFASIDVPNAILTQAFGINNLGTIVGTYTDARGVQHGFVVTFP
jgi:probable HAF family extracellular repeat protein